MDNKLLEELAKTVRLSPLALEIYILLKEQGELSADRIYDISNSSTDVQVALTELSKRHLILKKNEDQDMFVARTLLSMEYQIEQELKQIEQKKQMIDNLKNFVFPKITPDTKFFEFQGWNEIRQSYIELLKKARDSKTDILAFENNLVNQGLGEDFVDKIVELRTSFKVKAYVICPNQKEDKEYLHNFKNAFTEIKLIDGFNVDENINISGNITMSFSPDSLKGEFERNISKANTLSSAFWNIWNNN